MVLSLLFWFVFTRKKKYIQGLNLYSEDRWVSGDMAALLLEEEKNSDFTPFSNLIINIYV